MTISPYLQRIRAKIGSSLLVLPSVTVLPHDADGDETDGAAWVMPQQLGAIGLSAFARAQFVRLGLL